MFGQAERHQGMLEFFRGPLDLRVDHDEPLALLLVGDRGDDGLESSSSLTPIALLRCSSIVDVRHHFAADFGEAALAAGDVDEAVVVERGDVAGHVPAVAHHLGGQIVAAANSPA